MKTKEAIKFVSKHIADFKERTEDAFDKEGCKKLITEAEGVITLLKRGEKLEKIVEEIKYEIDWHRPEREVYDAGNKGDDEYINETLDLIDRIEQKYFPVKEKNENSRINRTKIKKNKN